MFFKSCRVGGWHQFIGKIVPCVWTGVGESMWFSCGPTFAAWRNRIFVGIAMLWALWAVCVVCVCVWMMDQMTTGVGASARRPLPCVVNSHPNATHTSTRPLAARTNVEPDTNSGETKSVLINYKFIKLQPFIRFVDVSATTATFIRMIVHCPL